MVISEAYQCRISTVGGASAKEGGREGKIEGREGEGRMEREGEGERDRLRRERVVISSLLAVSCHDSSLLYNLWSHLAKNVDVKVKHGVKQLPSHQNH